MLVELKSDYGHQEGARGCGRGDGDGYGHAYLDGNGYDNSYGYSFFVSHTAIRDQLTLLELIAYAD